MKKQEEKVYIINLAFDTWRNQLWFQGSNDEAFQTAKNSLTFIGEDCTNANDFFVLAVKHFESHGFVRIQR